MSVDPGWSGGALARGYIKLTSGELYGIHSIRLSNSTWPDILNWIREDLPDFTLLEEVSSYSGQGIASAFKFGRGLGRLEGFLMGMDLRYESMTPQQWQKDIGVQKKVKVLTEKQKLEDAEAIASRKTTPAQHKRDRKEAPQIR